MTTKTTRRILVLLIATLVVLTAWALAGASDDLAESLSIPWWTADGGGGRSSGGAYTLQGTAGQPDAGRASGGDYALIGGFWSAPPEQGMRELYMPIITR
jgi:hypothetical protein